MEIFYGPVVKAYVGTSPFPGLPIFLTGPYTTDSYLCSDILNSVNSFGDYFGNYISECDFVTLTNTGTIFFMKPSNMTIEFGMEITTEGAKTGFLTNDNLKDILYIETAFICTAILLFGIVRQLKKINSVLW